MNCLAIEHIYKTWDESSDVVKAAMAEIERESSRLAIIFGMESVLMLSFKE